MKKKIKVLVPKIIAEIIESDSNHFNLPREKLYNKIILNIGYKPTFKFHEKMEFEPRINIQFNLQKESEKYYFDIYKEKNAISDSELIRTIFSTYINLAPFLRERIIMKSKLIFIANLIKSGNKVKINTGDKIIESTITEIKRCPQTNYFKVYYVGGEEYLSKIRIIKK